MSSAVYHGGRVAAQLQLGRMSRLQCNISTAQYNSTADAWSGERELSFVLEGGDGPAACMVAPSSFSTDTPWHCQILGQAFIMKSDRF